MSSLLDHLTAIAAGTVVLLALVTLQMRDRVAAVEDAVSDVAQQQATSVADGLAQEFDNTLSEPMARDALGAYRCRLVRDAAGERTALVELPAFVRTVRGGAVRAATVQYQLVNTGRTVAVGTDAAGAVRTRAVYRLTREVDTGTGYGAAATVAENLVDFDVKFRGRASETFAGAPPLRFSQIAFQLVVAVTPPRALPGRTRTLQTNSARAVFAVRPPNLTTLAS